MSYITLKFNTDNAAFDDENLAHESSRILREVADKIESLSDGGTIRDINGNDIGTFDFVLGDQS